MGARARSPEERGRIITAIVVIILLLSALMAFAAHPGQFDPAVLLLGILVAAALFIAGRPGVRDSIAAPAGLAAEVRRLRQEFAEFREALEARRCPSCRALLPPGSRFCPQCGARQG